MTPQPVATGGHHMDDGVTPAVNAEPQRGPLETEPGAAENVAVEAEPAAAAALFGAESAMARRYVALLAGPGTVRGLIGPREAGRLWTRHVLNCAVAAEAIQKDARVVDIGSGAGLPGIPMALARPDLRIDLVETLLRRTTFLDEVVAGLGLADRVRVIRGRAEEVVAQVGAADAVTARAVAPLAKLAGWGAPLLRDGGMFVALKGSSAHEEIERDGDACAAAGIVDLSVRLVGGDLLAEPTTLILGRYDASRVRAGAARRSAGHPAARRSRGQRR
jgi:16S rRNA (guanine527-N7)-methyltransferase